MFMSKFTQFTFNVDWVIFLYLLVSRAIAVFCGKMGGYVVIYRSNQYISIKRWKNKPKTRGLLILDILRHGIFPAFLLALPYLLGSPLWLVWYFVKDLFLVLTLSSTILIGTGIYKIVKSCRTNVMSNRVRIVHE